MSKKSTNAAPVANVLPGPPGHAPAPPKGFKKSKGRAADVAATAQQERDALDVAREITSSKSYVEDFTNRAPDAATLAAELTVARQWSDELKAAAAWLAYVRVQREQAWEAALTTAKKLKPWLDPAVQHDPTIADRYPQTVAFLRVWKVAAARAAITKASKKKNAAPK
jgi:hypothetical protein